MIGENKNLIREINDQLLFTKLPLINANNAKDTVKRLCEVMIRVQSDYGGVGISANQCQTITNPLQLAIVGCKDSQAIATANQRYPEMMIPTSFAIINPELLEKHNKYIPVNGEGCLSVQGPLKSSIIRYQNIKTKYLDIELKETTKLFDRFAAHIFQHEYDHLQGKIYLDYVFESCTLHQLEEIFELINNEIINRNRNNIEISEFKISKETPYPIIFDMNIDSTITYDKSDLQLALQKTTNNTLVGLKNRLATKYLQK